MAQKTYHAGKHCNMISPWGQMVVFVAGLLQSSDTKINDWLDEEVTAGNIILVPEEAAAALDIKVPVATVPPVATGAINTTNTVVGASNSNSPLVAAPVVPAPATSVSTAKA